MKLPFRSFSRRIFLPALFFFLLPAERLSVSAATIQVLVGDGGSLSFSPSSVSIQAGDTVQWIWKSGSHSATSGTPGTPNGLWDSGVHSAGFTFSHTFPTA